MIKLLKYRNNNNNSNYTDNHIMIDGDSNITNTVVVNHHQNHVVMECIMDRIHNIQIILIQYHNTVHFLCSFTTALASIIHTAPCA